MALERFEWNKTQKYQSIVAMTYLSWNLARNIFVRDKRLHVAIKRTLLRSLTMIVQTLNFAKAKGLKIRYHGRKKSESAHYCGFCDEEVFNILFVKENEKKHVVHCLRCARSQTKDLKGFVCLEEYHLQDLLETYDSFQHRG